MPRRDDIRTILIIGSGPIVIGQGCEFDYSGTQAGGTGLKGNRPGIRYGPTDAHSPTIFHAELKYDILNRKSLSNLEGGQ